MSPIGALVVGTLATKSISKKVGQCLAYSTLAIVGWSIDIGVGLIGSMIGCVTKLNYLNGGSIK